MEVYFTNKNSSKISSIKEFNKNEFIIATASIDSEIKIWDYNKKIQLFSFDVNLKSITCLAIYDNYLISGCEFIKIWNINFENQSAILKRTLFGHSSNISCLIIQEKYLISGDLCNSIIIWDLSVKLGTMRKSFIFHDKWISTLTSFKKESKFIISGSGDCCVKVWDFKKGKVIRTFNNHRSWISSAQFIEEFDIFISSEGKNILKIWSLEEDLIESEIYLEDFERDIINVVYLKKFKKILVVNLEGKIQVFEILQK